MMEFEAAAQRLAKDQSRLRGRKGPPQVSAKAKRELEYRKRQEEKLRAEQKRKTRQLDYAKKYMTSCDRALAVTSLDSGEGNLMLQPTSIHGEGDKISLPPSVLERLTASEGGVDASGSSPWTFRIGLLRSDYVFPASTSLRDMQPPSEDDMLEDSDDEERAAEPKAAYLEELQHKYISYTHGTVVEFTQEEGHVGLPASIAAALIDPKRRRREDDKLVVPVTRTVDPAASEEEGAVEAEDTEEEKTPGHVAWGLFSVPNLPVEISLLKLPKGKACTLVPTEEAVRNGFYGLKDVRLVLEQSLIRTRATLSVGDTVHTWHRGMKFDLSVSSVTPPHYQAISCINTDIEVDIDSGDKDGDSKSAMATRESLERTSSFAPGEGQMLSAPTSPPPNQTTSQPQRAPRQLLPEPPLECTEGVCTVQIRGDGATARRRFDTGVAKITDLFAFAASVISEDDITSFRLVTRFPVRKFWVDDKSSDTSMAAAGITGGQELFMVERI